VPKSPKLIAIRQSFSSNPGNFGNFGVMVQFEEIHHGGTEAVKKPRIKIVTTFGNKKIRA